MYVYRDNCCIGRGIVFFVRDIFYGDLLRDGNNWKLINF